MVVYYWVSDRKKWAELFDLVNRINGEMGSCEVCTNIEDIACMEVARGGKEISVEDTCIVAIGGDGFGRQWANFVADYRGKSGEREVVDAVRFRMLYCQKILL